MKRTLVVLASIGACAFGFLYGYSLLSGLWVDYGHTSGRLLLVEFPFVFSFALLLFVPSRDFRKRIPMHLLVPFAPILALYLSFDLYYLTLDRTPKLSDCNSLWDLFRVSPPMALMLVGAALAALLPVLLAHWNWLGRSTVKDIGKMLAVKAAVLAAIVLAFDSAALYRFQKLNAGRGPTRTQYDVRRYGRIASLQFFHSHAHLQLKRLQDHSQAVNCRIGDYFWREALAEKRNVHILVLESFIDARRIHGADYGEASPLCPDLNKYLVQNGRFSKVVSPIYGGGTCQAEFEVLAGLPALALIENYEFLCLNGSPIDSFISALRGNGYRTVATIGASSRFFNSENAYRSIGFDEVHFIDADSYFSKSPEDTYIFDGDLLDADAARLEQRWLKDGNGRPLVNYVLGMYGHCPIRKDTNGARPDVIHARGEPAEVDYMANAFYYRTKAVARYLDTLAKIDPESIVLVISDHLPFPPTPSIRYDGEKRDNIAVLLDRFAPVDVSGKRYFEIPHVMWKLLCDDPDPLRSDMPSPQALENLNCVLMMEGMGIRRVEARKSLEVAASPTRQR